MRCDGDYIERVNSKKPPQFGGKSRNPPVFSNFAKIHHYCAGSLQCPLIHKFGCANTIPDEGPRCQGMTWHFLRTAVNGASHAQTKPYPLVTYSSLSLAHSPVSLSLALFFLSPPTSRRRRRNHGFVERQREQQQRREPYLRGVQWGEFPCPSLSLFVCLDRVRFRVRNWGCF